LNLLDFSSQRKKFLKDKDDKFGLREGEFDATKNPPPGAILVYESGIPCKGTKGKTFIRDYDQGEVYILGIGKIKAEGRTIDEIASEIQNKVNENFLPEKSEARLFLEGIKYTFLYDLQGRSLQKTATDVSVNILEAIAENGGLDRSVDRKNVIIYRKFPEGIKKAQIDLTREDLQNSPYFWLQNGDLVVFNTRAKSFYGFGKEPLQTLTTGVSILTTALSIYLLITKL
jgi:polysaccharide export outer membrane protein